MKSISLLLVLLVASCCTPKHKIVEVNLAAKASVDPGEQSCDTDKECVLTLKECCSCTMGGSRVAVNEKYIESIIKRRESVCEGIVCAAVISNDPSCSESTRAICADGVCQVN